MHSRQGRPHRRAAAAGEAAMRKQSVIDRVVLAAAAGLVLAWAGPAAARAASQGQDGDAGGVRCAVEWAPMRDGVRLATEVYLPAGDGPFPVILQRTPYNRRSPASGSDCDSGAGRYFAARGYALLNQDTRGRYRSEGEFDPHAAGGGGRLRRGGVGGGAAVVRRQGGHDRRLVRRAHAVAGGGRAAPAPRGDCAALQLVGLPQGVDVPGRRVRPVVRDELDRADPGPRHPAAAPRGGGDAEGAGARGGRRVRRRGAREARRRLAVGGSRWRTSRGSGGTATSPPTTTSGWPGRATTTTGRTSTSRRSGRACRCRP